MMRPRFSLKWLLIAFTILGVAFYVAFVRPTVIAQRFINLVEHDELQRAESLFIEPDKPFDLGRKEKSVPVIVEAELLPRTWHDVLKMQRRLEVHVIPTQPQVMKSGSGSYYVGMHYPATAGISGVRGSEKYFVSYQDVEKLILDRKALSSD